MINDVEIVENFKAAIIGQAVKDYATAYRKKDREEMEKIKGWFRSDYYRSLTEVDGEYFIRKLEENYDRKRGRK